MQVNLDSKVLGESRDCLYNKRTYCNSGEKAALRNVFHRLLMSHVSAIVVRAPALPGLLCHKDPIILHYHFSLQLNEMVCTVPYAV